MSAIKQKLDDDDENDIHHSPGSRAALSDELDGDGPWTIHGRAMGNDDVTRGRSRIRKKWPGEELKKGADSLKGRPLVKDHNNKTSGVIGEVTDVKYKDNHGIIYQAELDDEELAKKVARGRLEVSARMRHKPVSELETDEELDAVVVEDVAFENLSLVPRGASNSNTVEIGEHDELGASELAEAFGYETEELAPSYHEPSYSSTVSGRSWDGLDMEEFETDDLGEISDHFLVSDSGFPPENFSDLSFEVVDTDGSLVLEALQSAWNLRGHADDPDRVGSLIQDLSESFEWSPSETEENSEDTETPNDASVEGADGANDVDEAGESEGQSGDDSDADDTGENARWMYAEQLSELSISMKEIELADDEVPEAVDELGSPVVVDSEELSELQEKVKAAENDAEDELEAYEKLESVREEKSDLESQVEELSQKADEVNEVKKMYAEELADDGPFDVDDLMEFDLSTLREKSEELSESDNSPDPRGGDVDEEELEDTDPDEELEAEIEELESTLEWYESRGWESQAEDTREELSELKEEVN